MRARQEQCPIDLPRRYQWVVEDLGRHRDALKNLALKVERTETVVYQRIFAPLIQTGPAATPQPARTRHKPRPRR